MADKPSVSTRWREYRPSKSFYFWSCILCIAATMAIGFTWGGWVTRNKAAQLEGDAAQQARAQLEASYCVARFEAANNAATELAELKKTESWMQGDFISKGGWVTPPGAKDPVEGAADICVQQLLAAKLALPNAAASPQAKPPGNAG